MKEVNTMSTLKYIFPIETDTTYLLDNERREVCLFFVKTGKKDMNSTKLIDSCKNYLRKLFNTYKVDSTNYFPKNELMWYGPYLKNVFYSEGWGNEIYLTCITLLTKYFNSKKYNLEEADWLIFKICKIERERILNFGNIFELSDLYYKTLAFILLNKTLENFEDTKMKLLILLSQVLRSNMISNGSLIKIVNLIEPCEEIIKINPFTRVFI